MIPRRLAFGLAAAFALSISALALAAEPVTDANFQQLVKEPSAEKPIVVFFWAEWCGPCRTIRPELDEAVAQLALTLVTLNVDDNPTIAAELGIPSLPSTLVFRDGQPVGELRGAQAGRIADFLRPHAR